MTIAFTEPQANKPAKIGEPGAPELSRRVWQVASLAIIVEAALLRFYDLGLNPLHHDEGINGYFLTRLFREGFYHYDPTNYHGPSLYYFGLVSTYAFGLNTFAIRLTTALFGLATVWLVLGLRKQLGEIGALAAALFIAVSPGAVYHSRYFIHESLFVFFTLALVVAVLKYADQPKLVYLTLASVLAALLFATKETAVISAGVLIIAAIASSLNLKIRKAAGNPGTERSVQVKLSNRRQSVVRIAILSLVVVVIFVLVSVVMYSSFFSYYDGVAGAMRSLKFWASTSTSAHVQPWHGYLGWLWQEEAPILLLCAAGSGTALWQARNRFAVFATLWALGSLAAYSLIPYKKPWLALNIIVPMAIAGGYVVNVAFERLRDAKLRAIAAVLVVATLAFSAYQTIDLNFFHYDDERYAYVNAHTRREFISLVVTINQLAERAGTGTDTTIAVASPEYWPLPWYLRGYRKVGYFAHVPESRDAIVIGSETQDIELQTALGEAYERMGPFVLRPGINLMLYARREILK